VNPLPTQVARAASREPWDEERARLVERIVDALRQAGVSRSYRSSADLRRVHNALDQAWTAGSHAGWSAHGGLLDDEEMTVALLAEDLEERGRWWQRLLWRLSARYRLHRLRDELREGDADELANKLTLEDVGS